METYWLSLVVNLSSG